MKQELICIGCPMGCQLTAEVENGAVTSVTGNTCPRGDAYARRECVAPVRTVKVQAPIAIGDLVLQNVCGTGVDVVAAKNMART